jgi:hypothetical protein
MGKKEEEEDERGNKREEERAIKARNSPKVGQPRAEKAAVLAFASSKPMLTGELKGTSQVVMSLRWRERGGRRLKICFYFG